MTLPQILVDLMKLLFDLAVPAACAGQPVLLRIFPF
jgi:hypothetical protein